jgi:hypothetical protein
MNIQLTTAQRLQQELINGFITDLEKQIQQGNGAAVNADLGNMLNGLFETFDRNKDAKFNANELTGLTGHLRQLNNDQNIAQLFATNGQLNFATTSKVDITGDGRFNGQEDLVALQQIIASRSSTNTSQTVNPASSNTVSAGVGNPTNGVNHFNSRGSFFVTESGFTILTDTNVGGHQTDIYDNAGKMITRIWGDPHVGDGTTAASGWNWHFGNDSTFILPDGTEIMFNTEGNVNNNVYVTTGLYIKSGNDVYQTGQDFGTKTTGVASDAKTRNSSITKLAMNATEFDATYADAGSDANGAGVFAWTKSANNGVGGWAILTNGGIFQDVKNEDWGVYLQAGKASFDGQYDGQVSVSKAQMIAALDGDAVRSFQSLSNSPAGSQIVAGSNPPIKADDLFLNYYFKEGAETKELRAFSDMISNGSSAEKLSVLDNYIRNGTEVPLTDDQENKFLNYLITPATSGLAKTYLALIKNNAAPEKFELLDKLAKGEYSLNETQEDTFFDFLIDFQNAKLAETYAEIIKKGGNQSSITYLEDYAKGDLDIALSINQENQMLDYLGGSENSNIARSYVNFIQANATEGDLKILNDIYQKSNNIKEPIEPEDLKFFKTLQDLTNEYQLQISPQQFLEYLDHTGFDDINQIVAKIATHVETDNNSIKTQNGTSLAKDLLRVMVDPVKYDLSTNYKDGSVLIFKDILELQLKSLGELNQNDPKVIQSIKYASDRLALIEADLDPITGPLNQAQRNLYKVFTNGFPAGQTPTEAQSLAAVGLITTGGNFGSNVTFITNYARFVSSGDTTSANNLVEIANYFGSKPEYAGSIRSFTDTNLDTKTISTAKEIINFTKMLDAQNSPDLAGVILTANRSFLLDTMLKKKDNIFDPATESDLTKSFFQSLKEIFNEKPDSIDNINYSDFARNAISKFSNDLKANGVVNRNSFTTILVKDIDRGFLGIYGNDGIAQMQIDVFEGMLSFYQSQIQQENAKPEPNTSKIGQWQSQINANQTAINALRGTLS